VIHQELGTRRELFFCPEKSSPSKRKKDFSGVAGVIDASPSILCSACAFERSQNQIGCFFLGSGSEIAYSALRGDGLYSRGSDLKSSSYGSFGLPINLSLNSIACHVMVSDHQLLFFRS
jgi:hypothetical protein